MILEARDVTFARGGRVILDAVSVSADAGRLLAVVGPSGSGKSSLLALLAGLETPDSGAVLLEGRPVTRERDRLGIVLQGYGLVATLTAAENVEVALQARGRRRADVRRLAADLLDRLGLTDVADALVDQLSGGQQQRVAVARALVAAPDVVLADEPTAELDSDTQSVVLDALAAAAGEGAAVVIATHDLDVADRCDAQVRLRDGRVDSA